MESLEENIDTNKPNEIIAIKQSRSIWIYIGLTVLGVLIISLSGYFVVKNYFSEEPQEKQSQQEQTSIRKKRVSSPVVEPKEEELLLDLTFETYQKLNSFYYQEIVSGETRVETNEQVNKREVHKEDKKQIWLQFPDKALLKNYFTEILIEKDRINIKNDQQLTNQPVDNSWYQFPSQTISEKNLIGNERLAMELLNKEFSWLNPRLIEEIVSFEKKIEEEKEIAYLEVNYNVDRLKDLWSKEMDTQIKADYLEGYNIKQTDIEIDYQGEIWIDLQNHLPKEIIIRRKIKSKLPNVRTYEIKEIKSQISFDQFNSDFNIEFPPVFPEKEALVFPLNIEKFPFPGQKLEALSIYLTNPFDFPIDIVVEQDLPEGLDLINYTFLPQVSEDKIVWQLSLESKELSNVLFKFDYNQSISISSAVLTIEAEQLPRSFQFILPQEIEFEYLPEI